MTNRLPGIGAGPRRGETGRQHSLSRRGGGPASRPRHPRYAGRRQPYTQIGIRRIPCTRCGAPSVHQWQVCANGRRYVGACARCDVAVNALVLRFMRIPGAETLMAAYRKRVERDA